MQGSCYIFFMIMKIYTKLLILVSSTVLFQFCIKPVVPGDIEPPEYIDKEKDTEIIIRISHKDGITDISFSPEGKYIATESPD